MVWMGVAVGVLFALGLSGCGGGGSGGSDSASPVSAPVPAQVVTYDTSTGKAPGAKYMGVGTDAITPLALQFDVDGGYRIENTLITVQYPDAIGGCSYKEAGTSAACNVLAAGNALLLCDDTVATGFGVALFKADVQTATLAELAGLTLNDINCGAANAVRKGVQKFTVNAAADYVVRDWGNGIWNYNGSYLADIQGVKGFRYFDWQNRWVIYKVPQSGFVNYFVFDLFETRAGTVPFKSTVFHVQKAV